VGLKCVRLLEGLNREDSELYLMIHGEMRGITVCLNYGKKIEIFAQ
jgi:hypothetical protein